MKRPRRIGRGVLAVGLVVGGLVALLVVLNVLTTLVRIVQTAVLAAALLGIAYVAYELYTGWTDGAEEPRYDPDEDEAADADFQREVDEELAALSREVFSRETEPETE